MNNQGKRKKPKNTNQLLPMTVPTQAKASGLAYSVMIMLFYALMFLVVIVLGVAGISLDFKGKEPDWYLYLNYLLPQISIFLAIAIYFAWLKRPVKQAIKEQKCHPKYFLLAILLQIGLLSLGMLNDAFLRFLERFGYQGTIPQLPNLNGFGLVATIFCIAVLPAIFEEIFFRGVLLKGLRSFGTVGGIFLCGALFALYHQNPAQTIYQFICGIAFAFLAVRSGSVLPTIISHFLNNTIVIVLTRFGIQDIPSVAYVPYVIITSLCLIGSLAYLFFFDRPITTEKPKRGQEQEIKNERKRFCVCALVGITVFAINWISALAKGI